MRRVWGDETKSLLRWLEMASAILQRIKPRVEGVSEGGGGVGGLGGWGELQV